MNAPERLLTVWARADLPEARFSADEVLSWPPGLEALLTAAEIIRRGDNVTAVPCDACDDGHVEEVVRIESPVGSPVRAYILCPEAGRVAVPLDRLKQWAVDFAGLARALARALGVAGTIEEVVPTRLWSLGKISAAGKRREAFLARGATWDDAPRVLGPRLDASGEAFLLVPGELPHPDAWPRPPRAIALRHVARLDRDRIAIDRTEVESALSGSGAKRPRLTREQIEREFQATIDQIRSEAAAMVEDDPDRPGTSQLEVGKRLGLSRRTVQDRLELLNRYRTAAGEPELGWEDVVRGPRR